MKAKKSGKKMAKPSKASMPAKGVKKQSAGKARSSRYGD